MASNGKNHYKMMEDVEEYHPEPTEKSDDEGKIQRPNIRSALDLQRLKLEKLMKNPTKEIIIPDLHREKDYLQSVPSFVRNVMGSSAGAGSGEFHVYRHLRRKEYARQKYIKAKSIREQLDDDYREKLDRNKTLADEKTAKKRAKRQKKKQKKKQLGKRQKIQNQDCPNEDFSSGEDSESGNSDNEDQNTKNEEECAEINEIDQNSKTLSDCNTQENGPDCTSDKKEDECVEKQLNCEESTKVDQSRKQPSEFNKEKQINNESEDQLTKGTIEKDQNQKIVMDKSTIEDMAKPEQETTDIEKCAKSETDCTADEKKDQCIEKQLNCEESTTDDQSAKQPSEFNKEEQIYNESEDQLTKGTIEKNQNQKILKEKSTIEDMDKPEEETTDIEKSDI